MQNNIQQRIPKPFRSAEELLQPEISQINGAIPEWVSGIYMRTGPGKYDIEDKFTMNHVLDGYAILSKFEIKNGSVKFQKKFIESDAYKRAMLNKKPVVTEFGTRCYTDPNKSMLSRMWNSLMPEMTDNTNVGWFTLGNDLFATNDLGFFQKIDCCTMESQGRNEAAKLFGCNIVTAHPLTDEEGDGATYNIGISYLSGLKYNVIKIPGPSQPKQTSKDLLKQAKIICSIPTRNVSTFALIHSFGMTKKYLILIEQPLGGSIKKVLANMVSKGHGFFDWIEWRPEMKNKFIIIEKATGKVIKTEYLSQDPFFFFHYVNCYEEDDQLVIDLSLYPNNNVLENQFLDKLRNGEKAERDLPRIHRYVVPIIDDIKNAPENIELVGIKSSAKAVRKGNRIVLTPEVLTEAPVDFPDINRNQRGKSYRYFYGTGGIIPNACQHKLYKFDCSKKELYEWQESEHQGMGEPIFVKNPEAATEDDGVIISAVTDERDSHNDFLLFLDARSMTELGRAQFKAPLPLACHGVYIAEK